MKRILIILLFLFFVFYIFCQESTENTNDNVMYLKKGDIIPFNCVILTIPKFKQVVENEQKLAFYIQLLDLNLVMQIQKLENVLEIKDEKIILIDDKFRLEMDRRIELERKNQKLEIQNRILTITTATGWAISLSAIIGVGLYYLIASPLQNK